MAVVLFAACETDIDTPQVNSSDKYIAPVIGQCSDIIVNADNSKDETVVFSWKAADFGLPVQVLYTVYLTKGDKSAWWVLLLLLLWLLLKAISMEL